jgi:class 3 adenylate cyclase
VHNGRIVKRTGDSSIAGSKRLREFTAALACCAMA